MDNYNTPYVRIVEQPARSSVRFRYACEGRSAGPIPGAKSTSNSPTYPTIQVMNYRGKRAMVLISCVTASEPYRQHPHHLVGRVGCHNGICSMNFENEKHLCQFSHLGIQCSKRTEIASRLELRQQLEIDPTMGGFDHIYRNKRCLIDLEVIRLCFQVFIEDLKTKQLTKALEPVVSDPVYDKKFLPKLKITNISTTNCSMNGSKVMIFCSQIDEEDIEVVFYEKDDNGVVVWESIADLKPPNGEIHKRCGISLTAPVYPNANSEKSVNVFLQLRRPSDQRLSEPLLFTYLPDCGSHNCPAFQFNSFNTSKNLSNNLKMSGTKPNPKHKTLKEKPNNKQLKALNALNTSDGEVVCHSDSQSYCPEMNAIADKNYMNASYDIQDISNDNNLISTQCLPNLSIYSTGANDMLRECLKTIATDMESLADIQYSDYNSDSSFEENWNSIEEMNDCNDVYEYNEEFNCCQNQSLLESPEEVSTYFEL